jgi:hypothetical protein
VSRSEDIGQGNGLAGALEIVKKNHGGMLLWIGDHENTRKGSEPVVYR